MAKARVSVLIEGGRRLAEVDNALKAAAEGGLRKELRIGLQRAANPTVKELKAVVLGVQVTALPPGKYRQRKENQRPLRKTVSKALHLKAVPLEGWVRIEVANWAFPPGSIENPPSLPKYLDSTIGRYDRWRHPVFWPGRMSTAPANRVRQQRGQPWFFVTIDKRRDNMRREMFRAIDRVARDIAN